VAVPAAARVSVTAFDRALVAQLGLLDVADAVQAQARGAGLNPPPYFGSEVVARELGLRFNHPAPHDDRELYPSDAITRAEAAWSLAQVHGFSDWDVAGARETLVRFAVPALTGSQRRVLRVAVSKIGMPYVWGGETDGRAGVWGRQQHGGYDCSGFAWRVFKTPGFPAGRRIHGRTAAQQAGEIRRSQRIRLEAVQPGDLLFFGRAGFDSKATERGIVHMGIAISPDFMINSSGQGVAVAPLFDEWRRGEFAWARRAL
jgi:cell wall-associated NlpC family hydrolase